MMVSVNLAQTQIQYEFWFVCR